MPSFICNCAISSAKSVVNLPDIEACTRVEVSHLIYSHKEIKPLQPNTILGYFDPYLIAEPIACCFIFVQETEISLVRNLSDSHIFE